MPPLKILIVGGGIAGPALAGWLAHSAPSASFSLTILERHAGLRDGGQQVDLRGHGITTLRRMGLEATFRAHVVPERGLRLLNASSGATVAWFPLRKAGGSSPAAAGFSTEWEIMRGDLVRILRDWAGERVRWVFGKTLEGMEDLGLGRGVEVVYEGGERERFDLVVGADGQWSRVRRLMLARSMPEVEPVNFLGMWIASFTMPAPLAPGEGYEVRGYVATGGRAVMTRRQSPDAVQVYLHVHVHKSPCGAQLQAVPRGDVAAEKAALAAAFRGAGWGADDFLAAMRRADDFYLERLGTVRLPAWSAGNVVLLGDAAYCPSAVTGMGTTAALVGAYILAGELARLAARGGSAEDLPAALKAYEDRFRPFMEQVQDGITPDHFGWLPTSAVGIACMNFIAWLAALFRLDLVAKFFERERIKNWTLPEYDELEQRTE